MASARANRAAEPRQGSGAAERLIEAAEALYGRHGLEGVSLRQIGAAAGSGNNYAVQYHFGDAAGLVRGILARRLPEIDARQSAMLAALGADGRVADTAALVGVLLRPMVEQLDARGERSYARFVVALLNSSAGMQHCRDQFHLTPTAEIVLERLHALHAHIPRRQLGERLRLLSILVCTSVFNRSVPAADAAEDAALIDDVLAMATAGLASPPRDRPRRPRGA